MAEYIERQAVIDAVRETFKRIPTTAIRAMDTIKALPSADVVHVVHARWKKIGVWGRVYRCNQCGNFLDFDGVNAGRGAANFCPNCGAKMDGGDEHG